MSRFKYVSGNKHVQKEIAYQLKRIADCMKRNKNNVGKPWSQDPQLLLNWMKENKIKGPVIDITELWTKHRNIKMKTKKEQHNEYTKVACRIKKFDALGLVKHKVVKSSKGLGKKKIWWVK